jgi:arsenate reductase
MKKILFICTHNSARSQIAEGLTNYFYSENWQAFSAGTQKTRVKLEATQVLKEIGIDISHHYSKTVEEIGDQQFDIVVTVCDSAKESCPFFPGKKVLHKSFADPSDVKEPEARLNAFRKTRDEIKKWLAETLPNMNV